MPGVIKLASCWGAKSQFMLGHVIRMSMRNKPAWLSAGGAQPTANFGFAESDAPDQHWSSYERPEGGLFGRLLALQHGQVLNSVEAHDSNDPYGAGAGRAYGSPPQEFLATPQRPVRFLSQRLAR